MIVNTNLARKEMVHASLEQEQENYKARLNQIRGMNRESVGNNSMRRGHSQSMILESSSAEDLVEDPRGTKSYASKVEQPLLISHRIGSSLEKDQGPGPRSRLTAYGGGDRDGLQKDMEMMKERFAKLLLGEDMSGGGKGVSSALALSNAVTNLAASVFGEQRKLEPMAPENRSRWKKEIDWLLSVTDHIVEFIMITKQRTDIQMNIPALRKFDAMLIDCLDNFKDQNEFYYIAKDADDSEKGSKRDDKWWLPTVKVPTNGLSEVTKKWLQFQKDSVNQVLKAAMAINAQVLSEMEIPENYIESLPKDIGHALLESYSRILESLAHTVLSRIEDVLYADSLAQNPSLAQKKRNPLADIKITSTKFPNADEEIERLNAVGTPPSMTLSDFMGWTMDNNEGDLKAKEGAGNEDIKDISDLKVGKLANIALPKKVSYLENLGGLRSPTARH
uniref:PRONE domain-containing protein n=1 Tax=Chenopodium quinoa TaxID=63459 RepID=A0A803LNE9_CHEQI